MIYSYSSFARLTNPHILSRREGYTFIRVLRNTIKNINLIYYQTPSKERDIILRQKFKNNRNTRDNLFLLYSNRFTIWKIGYYQKNDDVLVSLLDHDSFCMGFIPEELITLELMRSIAKLYVTSIGKIIPEYMITPKIRAQIDYHDRLN